MKRLLTIAGLSGLCCLLIIAQPHLPDTPPKKPASVQTQQATVSPKKEEKDDVTKTDIVIAVVSSSLLTTILTLLGDAFFKRKIERNLKGDAEKVAKRITAYEKIYADCLLLQDYDATPAMLPTLLSQIASIQKNLRQNRLYIDDNLRKATLELLDFYTSLSNNPVNRDIATETELLDNIVTLFKK